MKFSTVALTSFFALAQAAYNTNEDRSYSTHVRNAVNARQPAGEPVQAAGRLNARDTTAAQLENTLKNLGVSTNIISKVQNILGDAQATTTQVIDALKKAGLDSKIVSDVTDALNLSITINTRDTTEQRVINALEAAGVSSATIDTVKATIGDAKGSISDILDILKNSGIPEDLISTIQSLINLRRSVSARDTVAQRVIKALQAAGVDSATITQVKNTIGDAQDSVSHILDALKNADIPEDLISTVQSITNLRRSVSARDTATDQLIDTLKAAGVPSATITQVKQTVDDADDSVSDVLNALKQSNIPEDVISIVQSVLGSVLSQRDTTVRVDQVTSALFALQVPGNIIQEFQSKMTKATISTSKAKDILQDLGVDKSVIDNVELSISKRDIHSASQIINILKVADVPSKQISAVEQALGDANVTVDQAQDILKKAGIDSALLDKIDQFLGKREATIDTSKIVDALNKAGVPSATVSAVKDILHGAGASTEQVIDILKSLGISVSALDHVEHSLSSREEIVGSLPASTVAAPHITPAPVILRERDNDNPWANWGSDLASDASAWASSLGHEGEQFASDIRSVFTIPPFTGGAFSDWYSSVTAEAGAVQSSIANYAATASGDAGHYASSLLNEYSQTLSAYESKATAAFGNDNDNDDNDSDNDDDDDDDDNNSSSSSSSSTPTTITTATNAPSSTSGSDDSSAAATSDTSTAAGPKKTAAVAIGALLGGAALVANI